MRIIPLNQGKSTIVDDEDYEWLTQWKWYSGAGGRYAIRRPWDRSSKRQVTIYMHRVIVNAPASCLVDHINGNGFDNRRRNLRLCTNPQNQYNSRPRAKAATHYKGIRYRPARGLWEARITVRGQTISVGWFTDETQAAKAYDLAALRYAGDFAFLNFPEVCE